MGDSRGNQGQDDTPSGFGLVSITCSNRILLIYISISSTMTSDFRLNLTARIEDGNRSSHIIEFR